MSIRLASRSYPIKLSLLVSTILWIEEILHQVVGRETTIIYGFSTPDGAEFLSSTIV